MIRAILSKNSITTETSTLPTSLAVSPLLTHLSPKAVEDRLRQKRSKSYVEAMTKLDSGGHVQTRDTLEALLAAIRSELPELTIEHLPLGIVARCHLGPPYEVHTLERDGSIIRHFKTFEALPLLLERARALALYPGYAFIEVYSDRLIVIANNGETSIVKG